MGMVEGVGRMEEEVGRMEGGIERGRQAWRNMLAQRNTVNFNQDGLS